MNIVAFTVAQADEWVAIYMNGMLVGQNHTMSAAELLGQLAFCKEGLLGADDVQIQFKTVDEAWLEEQGYMPQSITEVKWEE
jgi:hypothetical protein